MDKLHRNMEKFHKLKKGKKIVKSLDRKSQLKGSEEDQKRIKELEQQLRGREF